MRADGRHFQCLRPRHAIGAAILSALTIAVTLDVWKDVALTALQDEESGYILLVPLIAAWLVWVRRDRIKNCKPRGHWVGVLLAGLGWACWSYGYRTAQHTFWDAGAILAVLGSCVVFLGRDILVEFLPAVFALAFLIPVWPVRRAQLAWPMQLATAKTTQAVCQALGMEVIRQGNLLVSNGVNVAIAEACNGMRMVLTLMLVSYVYVFITPLRTWVRILLLVLSPVTAVVCNVIRLVPTVYVYGHASPQAASRFHDISGWVMLAVAFLLLMGIVRLLRWLDIPVMRTPHEPGAADRVSSQTAGSWRVVSPVLCCGLIAGMMLERRTFAPPPDAAPYHHRVKIASEAIPLKFGDWVGQDVELPYDVWERLKPNVMISRRYKNTNDGREVSFLFVQCEDARLLANHYPPACYGNEGCTQLLGEPRDWTVDDLNVTGTEYEFTHTPGRPADIAVANFMIAPDGQFWRDITPVNSAAADLRARYYGAAEVQVVYQPSLPHDVREETVKTFVQECEPLIREIRSGMPSKVAK